MTRQSKIRIVIELLHTNKVETDICSPNYVADFAYARNIKLTCEEIVQISNEYELPDVINK